MRSILATGALLAAITAPAPAMGDKPSYPTTSPTRPILVIIASSSTVDSLSLDDLARIFDGQTPELHPLNLPPGSRERIGFDQLVLGRSPDDIARYWIDRKIRGQGGPPRVIPNGRLLARIVARLPGTIGYTVDGPLPPGVKVLRIGGLSPDHPRYPLFITEKPR
ncbi:MAG TPA: hypothetical protein VK698_11310 [Kofleriaceae bacterium]|nr:hypothetical protein [Kofleriaceae bacterium]